MTCGLAYLRECDEVWVFRGNGVSRGMQQELKMAELWGKHLVERGR